MRAMVLAAGEGTRLRPLTLTVPKPLLPVANRPTLEWIFCWLRSNGISEIVVNLCHQYDAVTSYFGTGSGLGIRLTYSVEESLLGTAGGIKRVEHLFQETFVVVYGDVLTDLALAPLLRFHEDQGTDPHLTLSVYHAPNPWACGIVSIDSRNRVTRIVEKPDPTNIFSTLANAGVLVADPPILTHVPAGRCVDIASDLVPALLKLGVPVYAQPVGESAYLIDMGTPEKYARAQKEWPTPAAKQSLSKNG